MNNIDKNINNNSYNNTNVNHNNNNTINNNNSINNNNNNNNSNNSKYHNKYEHRTTLYTDEEIQILTTNNSKTTPRSNMSVSNEEDMQEVPTNSKAPRQIISTNWQTIPMSKRQRSVSPIVVIENENKKPKHNENRFSVLALEAEKATPDPSNPPKPPPIYLPHITDIDEMIHTFSSIITRNDFHYKSTKGNEIRVMASTIEAYRKLTKLLETNQISYHTYQPKQERGFRFVIKGLHHTTCITSIKAELILLGHQVRSISNAKGRFNKQPLSMFFVEIDSNTNNKDVYNIKHIANAMVTIEPVRKTGELVQCHRCQEFGHTKSYCRKQFRCVKCADNHATSECKKQSATPARCVHCQQSHTANYKGCPVYQNLVKKPIRSAMVYNTEPNYNINSANRVQNVSYAEAARPMRNDNTDNTNKYNNSNEYFMNTVLNKIESLFNKQTEFINNMMNMLNTILNKLCK